MIQVNLISENDIKTNLPLGQNVDSQLLILPISQAQNTDFCNLIGQDLFDRVINEFTAFLRDGTPAVSPAITNLVDKSFNYLLYRVLVNGIYSFASRITNKGVVEQNSENTTNVSTAMVNNMKEDYSNFANLESVKIIDFIKNNISDYPEFTICEDAKIDNVGVYLGDEI